MVGVSRSLSCLDASGGVEHYFCIKGCYYPSRSPGSTVRVWSKRTRQLDDDPCAVRPRRLIRAPGAAFLAALKLRQSRLREISNSLAALVNLEQSSRRAATHSPATASLLRISCTLSYLCVVFARPLIDRSEAPLSYEATCLDRLLHKVDLWLALVVPKSLITTSRFHEPSIVVSLPVTRKRTRCHQLDPLESHKNHRQPKLGVRTRPSTIPLPCGLRCHCQELCEDGEDYQEAAGETQLIPGQLISASWSAQLTC